jgi:SAM-dependent methyltransferase
MSADDTAGEDWRDLNRAWWDERVPVHVASNFYDAEGFKAGKSHLRPFELDEVGDVTGRSLVHLQCHFGLDTLSWARRGARVTGLDFSEPAMAAARRLAADTGLDAEFVHSDVYEAPSALGGRRFDIVYTGLGALNWLPDLTRWARTAAGLVAPGGFFYLAEFHPLTQVMADEDLSFERSYFDRTGTRWDDDFTYTDGPAKLSDTITWEWNHGLGDVVSALIDAGLRIEMLHEHDFTLFERWPWLQRHDDGTYRFPPDRPTIPLIYSVRARKPN